MSASLRELHRCFEGAIPAVIATAAADGTPNITYLSRVQLVDDERVALSNQFFSKTVRNLAENPQASVLLMDPTTYDQYKLHLAYERTERRGPVFERLREEIVALAALTGMESVFKLRAADIYRVVELDLVPSRERRVDDLTEEPAADARPVPSMAALAEVTRRLARSSDLDSLVGAAVDALARVFGYEHSTLLLVDEDARLLYTVASHGYDAEGVGSEIVVGDGMVGMAAARGVTIRVGNLRQMSRYSRTVRQAFEDSGAIGPASIPLPALLGAQSRVAVPAMAGGQVVAVLLVESPEVVAFSEADEHVLQVIASIVAQAVEAARVPEVDERPSAAAPPVVSDQVTGPAAQVRFFPVDGSTFIDGDYLIKGVAGRILWALARAYEQDGRLDFTNRELRLDPSLELPPYRDNLESRLLLLKRRLDERSAPLRIERAGRGRFRIRVEGALRLEEASGTV
jgi:predicted pyridoxine 5'-phosphate oxidase superfamily flavin-nucleotide-binding protein